MNIALVGFGFWGKVWHKVISSQPGVHLVCVYGRSLSSDGVFTADFQRVTAPDVEAVIVACSTPAHFEVVKACLNAGKHVLCEKPLTLSSAQARELEELARSKHLALHTNFSYLESPTIQSIKAELPHLGEIHCMESWIDGFGNFYADEDAYSVHSPHVLAVTFALFPKQIFEIDTINLVFSKLGTVDVGLIRMRAEGLTALHHTSLRGISRERKIVIYGSKGVAEYDATTENQFALRGHEESGFKIVEGETKRMHFDETLNVARSFARFLRVVRGEERSNLEVAVKVTAALELIGTSIRRPERVA